MPRALSLWSNVNLKNMFHEVELKYFFYNALIDYDITNGMLWADPRKSKGIKT